MATKPTNHDRIHPPEPGTNQAMATKPTNHDRIHPPEPSTNQAMATEPADPPSRPPAACEGR